MPWGSTVCNDLVGDPLERLRDWIDDPTDSVPWIRRTLYALLAIQALTFLAAAPTAQPTRTSRQELQ